MKTHDDYQDKKNDRRLTIFFWIIVTVVFYILSINAVIEALK